nr:hypothetical protein [Nannocystis sp.]
MKIDAEKFLAMTVLLATTAGTPACGKKDDEKKVETKAAPVAPAAPAPTTPTLGPGPTAQPPAAMPEVVEPPPTDDKAGASAGGGAAKPDPGPEEEKPSW